MIGFSSNHPQLPTGHALNINHNRFYWKSISGIAWNFQFIYLACTFLAQLNFHFWYEIKHSLTKSVGNRHFHILSDSLKLGGTFKVHILLSVYSFFSKWKVAKHKKVYLLILFFWKTKAQPFSKMSTVFIVQFGRPEALNGTGSSMPATSWMQKTKR